MPAIVRPIVFLPATPTLSTMFLLRLAIRAAQLVQLRPPLICTNCIFKIQLPHPVHHRVARCILTACVKLIMWEERPWEELLGFGPAQNVVQWLADRLRRQALDLLAGQSARFFIKG